MKQFGVILAAMLFAVSSAFADGTKQFMPNKGTDDNPQPQGTCYMAIGAREGGSGPGRPFARYSESVKIGGTTYTKSNTLGEKDSVSAPEEHRLHIRIEDPTTERIHFGFGKEITGEGPSYGGTLYYRIKDPQGYIVKTEAQLPNSGDGFIGTYAKAYYGPKSIDSRGYDYLELIPTKKGDYYIEFNNRANIGEKSGTATSIEFFDATVVKDGEPIEGRVWSRAWGLNTNGSSNKTYTSFYTMSTDMYVSKVYLDGFQPYQFVIACNSYGSVNTGDCEEDRKSMRPDAAPYDDIPEYMVFLTRPDADYWGKAKIPNVPDKLTFAGDAMTCEDLIFVVQLLYNENATLELYMDTDQDGITDKVIAALLQANVIKDRGFHYPWKDRTELKEAGQGKYFYNPAADGCARRYTLSLFDQTYSYPYVKMVNEEPFPTTDRVNPGDSLQAVPRYNSTTQEYEFLNTSTNTWDTISMTYPIGSEQNPVLIESASDLQNLAGAVNGGGSFSKCIENFYHYWEDGVEQHEDYCYTISNAGDNEGFRNTYFYIVAPTGTIELNDWWGIGKKTSNVDRPFRGHIRAGRYQPNPTDDLTNETRALSAGDQDTIIIHGTNGLFAYCDGATIENIHVKGNLLDATGTVSEDIWAGIGGICDIAKNTTFSHCSNACKIELDEDCEMTGVGGIVGYGVHVIVDSCSNYGSINSAAASADAENFSGGIVGFAVEGTTINFCYNVANVKDIACAGGIIGGASGASGSITISNCKNEGYIQASTSGSAESSAGGIAGFQVNNTSFISCLNTGTVYADDAAGICYGNSDLTISYCMNEGIIYGAVEDVALTKIMSDTEIEKSISTRPAEYYVSDATVTSITDANKAEIYEGIAALNEDGDIVDDESPFYLDADGNLKMFTTECCGRTFRQEDAGRLFNSNTTFYIKWDGKDSEGECVTGDVTVSYQKNSGVTHFPFYDPENVNISDCGLVVYRISPIQDSILNAPPLSADAPKANKYGYQQLPKDYFGSGEYTDEMGIELKLFWDDTKISVDGSCTNEVIAKKGGDGYIFGESKTSEATYENLCTGYTVKSGRKTIDICESSAYKKTTAGVKHCTKIKSGYTCQKWQNVKTSSGTSKCKGVSNLGSSDVWSMWPNSSKEDKTGGYYGSTAGGHLFPKSNFGDKNTMNTWWNGVEVKQLVPLKLTANEPAVLMPIEMTMWTATNLEESVLLEWTTASEENNDYFAIERSIDGVTWKVLGNVGGAGTTSATHYYSFEDTKPVSGISYYRLKQVDFNGEYTYSSVKCINRPANADKMYKAYVNQDIDAFIVQGEEIAACNIEVYNNLGVKMTNLSFNPISTDKVVINVGQLPVGTYFIKICNGSKSVVKSW